LSGKSEAVQKADVKVPKFGHLQLPVNTDLEQLDPATEFLVVDAGADRSLLFLAEDCDLAYESPNFELTVTAADQGVEVDIVANNLLRELCLFVDRLDDRAEVSDQVVTLLAGESATLIIKTDRPELFTEATLRKVARAANEFRSLAG
jgi:beta-mannosidase